MTSIREEQQDDLVERLRALADKVKPQGEWRMSPWHIEEGASAVRASDYGIVASTAGDTQAEFIAACNPVNIRALLDRLVAVEKENAKLAREALSFEGEAREAKAWAELAEKELAAARHEASCCDDINLSQPLAGVISDLQAERERMASAARHWRDECGKKEARASGATEYKARAEGREPVAVPASPPPLQGTQTPHTPEEVSLLLAKIEASNATMKSVFTHPLPVANPGSDEAVAKGCTCARIDNGRGKGWRGMAGVFVYTSGCPLHWPIGSARGPFIAVQSQEMEN